MAASFLRHVQVDLRHLITCHSIAVVRTNASIEAVVFRPLNPQPGVFKLRIGEAESEEEAQLHLRRIEPAIADEHTFREGRAP